MRQQRQIPSHRVAEVVPQVAVAHVLLPNSSVAVGWPFEPPAFSKKVSVFVMLSFLLDPEGRGTDVVQDAAWAVRLAGLADAATVEDEEVREERPLSFGHHSQEITL